MDEIAYFLPKAERNYNIAWAKEMISEKWISRNWNSQMNNDNKTRSSIGKRISDHNGIILEIGTGPGGGFMPCILKNRPDATIIISDLSPTVVCEWKRLLDNELDSPNIYYAAFDFCEIPFSDNSIDVISDNGGIGNAVGNKGNALKEVYRVLKPGGFLVTSTGFVTKETLTALPESSQKTLKDKRPDIFEDLYEATVLAGFKKIDSIICGCWYTKDDESTIADLANELGINLKFTSYVRYCEK
ncbi:MAG: class I SAM-dependent methyltransferase [Clostridia bacterium]